MYDFIMARCCATTIPDLPEATGDQVGCTGTLSDFTTDPRVKTLTA